MKTKYFAQKDLVIEGKPVKRGDLLATVDADHPIERVLNGLSNGAVGTELPKGDAETAVAAAEAKKK